MGTLASESTELSTGSWWTIDSTQEDTHVIVQIWDPGKIAAANLFLVLLSCIAIVTNFLLILVIVRSSQLRTSTNAFIVSIAISDLILAVLVVLPSGVVLHITSFSLREGACCWIGIMQILSHSATSLSLMMVSVDRCIAVHWSLQYSHVITKSSVSAMLAIVWIFSLVIALLPGFGWGRYFFNEAKMACSLDWLENLQYTLTQKILCSGLPGLVISVMILLILKAAFAQRRVFALMPMPGLALAMGGAPQTSVNYRRSTLQAMKTFFFIMGALTVLWTPIFFLDLIYFLIYSGGLSPVPDPTKVALTLMTYVSYLSCILNPFVFLSNRKYKQRLQELLGVLGENCVICISPQVYPLDDDEEQYPSRHTTMTPLPSTSHGSPSSLSASAASLGEPLPSLRQLYIDTKANTLKVPTFVNISPNRLSASGYQTGFSIVTRTDIPEIIVTDAENDSIFLNPLPSVHPSQRLSLPQRLPSDSDDNQVDRNMDIRIHIPQRRSYSLSTI